MRALAAVLLAISLSTPAACAPRDKAVWTKKADPAMVAAMEQARKSLPQFWAAIEAHPDQVSDVSVKLGYPTAHGGVEYLWIYLKDREHGEIANEPEDVPNVHAGQAATVDAAKIADWTYAKAGRYYGQYTTRVMLEQVDAKTRQAEGGRLAPTPVESEVR